jgi:hypothetical protein
MTATSCFMFSTCLHSVKVESDASPTCSLVVYVALSSAVKTTGPEFGHLPPRNTEINNRRSILSQPNTSSWIGAYLIKGLM